MFWLGRRVAVALVEVSATFRGLCGGDMLWFLLPSQLLEYVDIVAIITGGIVGVKRKCGGRRWIIARHYVKCVPERIRRYEPITLSG